MLAIFSFRSRLFRALLLSGAVAAFAAAAQSQDGPNAVLVENKWTQVTRADYEVELQRLPPDLRGGFGADPKRVADLISRILLSKSLAAQARAAGLDKEAMTERRLALEQDKLVAGVMVEKFESDAGKAFDARLPQYEGRAREIYLSERQRYVVPEQVAATHILFDLKKHTKDEALELARKAKAKIAGGADFGALAKEVSDDPTAAKNSGNLGFFAKAEMDPKFADAAFALAKVGDVSEPVLSSFGWHLIKLDGRRAAGQKPFDEVKESIIAEMRKKYVDDQRDAAVRATRTDASTKAYEKAIDALVVRVDPEIIKRMTVTPPAPDAAKK